MKVISISRQVRIFNVYADDGVLLVDLLGGSGNTCKTLVLPPAEMSVNKTLGWLEDETDLDLLWREGCRDSPYVLRPSAIDIARPPAEDTAAARYMDGRRQGQHDVLGLPFRHPLPLPRRKPEQ